jgi:phosphoribosylformylglycinamidine (FGAM) synthase-like enzyme
VKRPGAADAAVVRWKAPKGAGADHRLHAALLPADPRPGGAQAVAEAWRNLTATGARRWRSPTT